MGIRNFFTKVAPEKSKGHDRELAQGTIWSAVEDTYDSLAAFNAPSLEALDFIFKTLNEQNGIVAKHVGTIGEFDWSGKYKCAEATFDISCHGIVEPIKGAWIKVLVSEGEGRQELIVLDSFAHRSSFELGRGDGFDFHDANKREEFFQRIGRAFGEMKAGQLPSYNRENAVRHTQDSETLDGVPKLRNAGVKPL